MTSQVQHISYGLIISQLKYDRYVNIAAQLEDALGIHARAKNFLCELIESIEHQNKIAAYFCESKYVPTLLSKGIFEFNHSLSSQVIN